MIHRRSYLAFTTATLLACGGGTSTAETDVLRTVTHDHGSEAHEVSGEHGAHTGEHRGGDSGDHHGDHHQDPRPGHHGGHAGPAGHQGAGGMDHAHGHDGHAFADPEHWAPAWNSDARDAWQRPDAIFEATGIGPGLHVVDLGAGTGYFTAHLVEAVGAEGRVTALDAEPNMVRYLEERAANEGWSQVEIRQVPYHDPQLEAGEADRVLIVNTWHHIMERRSYAEAVYSGVRPGGSLVIVDFTLDAPVGPPPAMRLAPETVVAELEAAGFEASIAALQLERQYVVVGVRPR